MNPALTPRFINTVVSIDSFNWTLSNVYNCISMSLHRWEDITLFRLILNISGTAKVLRKSKYCNDLVAMVARTENTLGNIMWWGLTPAMNLAKCFDSFCFGDHFDSKSSIFTGNIFTT